MCIQNYNVDQLSPFGKELPDDLWVEIFIRSAVESLLRVKAVCKHWYALIKNPSFKKWHLKYQKLISRNRGLFLLQECRLVDGNPHCFLFDEESLASGDTSASSSYTVLLDPCIHIPMVSIHGPINGLYCVYSGDDRLVIWNPATSEVGFLPLPQEYQPHEGDIYFGAIGFGTDPLDEVNYKVMLFCKFTDEWSGEWCDAMLYTASTNTWRHVGGDLGGLGVRLDPWYFSSNNTFLNGVYYWFYENPNSFGVSVPSFERMILALDMGKKEAFRTIPIPNVFLDDREYRGDIALHKQHIALFVVDKNMYDLDIWMLMVEDNIWIKRISVKGVQGIISSLGFSRMDDEVLLLIDDDSLHHEYCQTVVYNTTTKKVIRNVGPRGYYTYFRRNVYYESLVSVTGEMTKYRGNHASVLDAVSSFLSG